MVAYSTKKASRQKQPPTKTPRQSSSSSRSRSSSSSDNNTTTAKGGGELATTANRKQGANEQYKGRQTERRIKRENMARHLGRKLRGSCSSSDKRNRSVSELFIVSLDVASARVCELLVPVFPSLQPCSQAWIFNARTGSKTENKSLSL